MPEIAVVYLARVEQNESYKIQEFVASYKEFQSGIGHHLYVVHKGQGKPRLDLFKGLTRTDLFLPDDGYDWGAYMRTSLYLTEKYCCFMNTNTRVLKNNWLLYLVEPLRSCESVGLTGASGSNSSWRDISSVPVNPWLVRHLREALKFLSRLVKGYTKRGVFPVFPNPHVRSNAFCIETECFREFLADKRIPKSKFECHVLESGNEGLSRFVVGKKEKSFVLVDKHGGVYFPSRWEEPRLFRQGIGEDLLVADNQTDDYVAAGPRMRKVARWSAWHYE